MGIRWILAIGAEAAFWTLFATFLVLRYRFGLDRASVAVLVAIVADHVVLLGLGVWDYLETGHVSLYTAAIVAILVYALTLGKRDMKRLDAWARRRLRPRSRAPRGGRAAPLHRS